MCSAQEFFGLHAAFARQLEVGDEKVAVAE